MWKIRTCLEQSPMYALLTGWYIIAYENYLINRHHGQHRHETFLSVFSPCDMEASMCTKLEHVWPSHPYALLTGMYKIA